MALWGYTDMNDPRWIWGTKFVQLKCDPLATTPQKIGMMNTLGWAAYSHEGQVMIKRFGFDAKATYPDFGCNLESYTQGDLLEVESLGPLAKIEPEGKIEHTENWFLFKAEIGEDKNLDSLTALVRQTEMTKRH
ncbi:MAG: hypothetical protein M3Y82_09820, partial [Verrucomicrobiota bacterium]|nr:hypothetical protein [Verrucomicrobiota bacterium]